MPSSRTATADIGVPVEVEGRVEELPDEVLFLRGDGGVIERGAGLGGAGELAREVLIAAFEVGIALEHVLVDDADAVDEVAHLGVLLDELGELVADAEELDGLLEGVAEDAAGGHLGGLGDFGSLEGEGGAEEDGVVIEDLDVGGEGGRGAAEEHGVRGEDGAVEAEVGGEALGGEELQPVERRADVDVGGLVEVAGGGGEEDDVGEGGEVGEGAGGFVGGEVLEDFDAGDEVVAGRGLGQGLGDDWLGDGGDAAVGADVFADVLDGELGDVCAPGLDAAIAEGFDEEAEGAAGVEGGLGFQILDEGVGHGAEEVEPVLVVLVGFGAAAGAVVLGVIGGSAGFARVVVGSGVAW